VPFVVVLFLAAGLGKELRIFASRDETDGQLYETHERKGDERKMIEPQMNTDGHR
jgi:hypothetical protein